MNITMERSDTVLTTSSSCEVAHGRLEERAERIEQGDMIAPNDGHGAVQNQRAGNNGGEPGETRTRDPMIKSHGAFGSRDQDGSRRAIFAHTGGRYPAAGLGAWLG